MNKVSKILGITMILYAFLMLIYLLFFTKVQYTGSYFGFHWYCSLLFWKEILIIIIIYLVGYYFLWK